MRSIRCSVLFASLVAFLPVRAAVAGAPGLEIAYTLEEGAQVSLVVRDPDGRVVRELLHAAEREAGGQVERWDGLDEQGQPVPAGDYTWKLRAGDGLQAEYLLTLGTNADDPPGASWPGNHGALWSLATDETGIYFGGGCGEGNPQLVKYGYDGKRQWDIPNWLEAWGTAISIAANGQTLYLKMNKGLFRFDAATGQRQGNPWQLEDVSRIAIRDEQLVSVGSGKLQWIHPATGAVEDSVDIAGALDVTVDLAGRVLVIAEGQVLGLTRDSKTPVTVVSADLLESPVRLSIDPTTGEILVAENCYPAFDNGQPESATATGNRVKRFTPGGELVKAYGNPGGRNRQGRYRPQDGFLGIYDIAADHQGGFLVTEPPLAPRRTARYNREGDILREWYGGQMYANHAAAEPHNPAMVWLDSHWGELIRAKVDYENGTWEVYGTYRFAGLADGLIGGTRHGGGRWYPRRRNGITYLAREASPCVVRFDEEADRLVPVVASSLNITHHWDEQPAIIKELLDHNPAHRYRSYIWTDANGDGRVQPEEVRFSEWAAWWGGWHVDDDLNYYVAGVIKIPVIAWTDDGVPIYPDWGDPQQIARHPADIVRTHSRSNQIWRDEAGNLFGIFNTEHVSAGGRAFGGAGHFSSGIGGNRVVKWDAQGNHLWSVGRHAATRQAAPGEAMFLWRNVGTAKGCIVVADVKHSMIHVWDHEGLWVGRILDNPDYLAPASYSGRGGLCSENFSGTIYTVPEDVDVPGLQAGDVLFFGGGQNNSPVYRVTGWEPARREEGRLVLTEEMAGLLVARVEEARTRPDLARIAHIDERHAQINADLAKWEGFSPIEIRDGDELLANVYLGWNRHGLYAAFDVYTTAPWDTSSTPDLAFQGGAAVDINIGPMEPVDRTQAIAGDMRYVVAPLDNRELLIEMMPIMSGVSRGHAGRPVTYQTDQGRITFERVAALNQDQVASRVKQDGSGYIVEFRIPPREPMQMVPGFRFRFDASLMLADEDEIDAMVQLFGHQTVNRILWHSTSPSDRTTNDVYLESLLRPANWGYAILE